MRLGKIRGARQLELMFVVHKLGKARPVEVRAAYQDLTGRELKRERAFSCLNNLVDKGWLVVKKTVYREVESRAGVLKQKVYALTDAGKKYVERRVNFLNDPDRT